MHDKNSFVPMIHGLNICIEEAQVFEDISWRFLT